MPQVVTLAFLKATGAFLWWAISTILISKILDHRICSVLPAAVTTVALAVAVAVAVVEVEVVVVEVVEVEVEVVVQQPVGWYRLFS